MKIQTALEYIDGARFAFNLMGLTAAVAGDNLRNFAESFKNAAMDKRQRRRLKRLIKLSKGQK